MKVTDKLNLNLPGDADLVNPEDINANARALEEYATTLVQACSVHAPGAMDLSTEHNTVSFGAITANGPAFALSGGGAKLAEAGFVVVSINLNLHSLGSEDRVSADVCKNGATFYQYSTELSYGWEATLVQTTMLIPVAANDIITVKAWNDTEDKGSLNAPASWMTLWYLKDLNL